MTLEAAGFLMIVLGYAFVIGVLIGKVAQLERRVQLLEMGARMGDF